MTIHLNIGSNQGDSRALIARAVALIASVPGIRHLTLSDYVVSSPWGYDSSNSFINRDVMATADDSCDPLALLDALQGIERRIGGRDNSHRNPDGSYRDRCLDIDIITFGRRRIVSPRLTVPHPLAAKRPFVMTPLRQLDPDTAAWLLQ